MRSLAVGFVYALASALLAFVLGPLSRQGASIENVLVWFVSGSLTVLALAPFLRRSAWSRRNTVLAAAAAIIFVRSLGLGIEDSLFKPTQAVAAIAGAAGGILIALLVAWLSVRLLAPPTPRRGSTR